jgi:hypothetical protein
LLAAPRTDPYVRDYRIRFLSRIHGVKTRRTPPNPWDTRFPLCVGRVLDGTEFSLTNALPSTTSAGACAPLFGGFIGTTALCDSSAACLSGLWLFAFPDRSRFAREAPEVSRFSCMQFLSVPGVSDYAGPPAGSRYRRRVCGLPPQVTGSASRSRFFRSSIPCPLMPLSTLRRQPRDCLRKTRGQAVRYSFPVRLLHPQLHAGLSRRTT